MSATYTHASTGTTIIVYVARRNSMFLVFIVTVIVYSFNVFLWPFKRRSSAFNSASRSFSFLFIDALLSCASAYVFRGFRTFACHHGPWLRFEISALIALTISL
jgi:hypothetical protein